MPFYTPCCLVCCGICLLVSVFLYLKVRMSWLLICSIVIKSIYLLVWGMRNPDVGGKGLEGGGGGQQAGHTDHLPTLPIPTIPFLPTLPMPAIPFLPTLPIPTMPFQPTLPIPTMPFLPTLQKPTIHFLPVLPSLAIPFLNTRETTLHSYWE